MKKSSPEVLGRRIRRVALVGLAVAMVFFFTRYGSYRVIAGMDTMPELPPGTLCIIQHDPARVLTGTSVVLVEVEPDAALLTRVAAVLPDGIRIRHDNRESRFVRYEDRTFPMDAVKALVLTSFAGDPPPGEFRGR